MQPEAVNAPAVPLALPPGLADEVLARVVAAAAALQLPSAAVAEWPASEEVVRLVRVDVCT